MDFSDPSSEDPIWRTIFEPDSGPSTSTIMPDFSDPFSEAPQLTVFGPDPEPSTSTIMPNSTSFTPASTVMLENDQFDYVRGESASSTSDIRPEAMLLTPASTIVPDFLFSPDPTCLDPPSPRDFVAPNAMILDPTKVQLTTPGRKPVFIHEQLAKLHSPYCRDTFKDPPKEGTVRIWAFTRSQSQRGLIPLVFKHWIENQEILCEQRIKDMFEHDKAAQEGVFSIYFHAYCFAVRCDTPRFRKDLVDYIAGKMLEKMQYTDERVPLLPGWISRLIFLSERLPRTDCLYRFSIDYATHYTSMYEGMKTPGLKDVLESAPSWVLVDLLASMSSYKPKSIQLEDICVYHEHGYTPDESMVCTLSRPTPLWELQESDSDISVNDENGNTEDGGMACTLSQPTPLSELQESEETFGTINGI
ncbi:hypothetical protein K402DRAFT_467920 [Aulographum hederae CBS 113979]|uniref:Uncharacterized protein n=1 Tax=Aulographum hederae CBS 113979 TaxID=1176131 RepID=A0A6G1GJK7_9PEZI|nr:hypothetical protein K402DRAFT_467920 [Aulographum hederae CBS 113979]